MLNDKPGPSPWLVFGLSSLVTIGGLVWGASSRDADLRHETGARVALEARVATLETRQNADDVTSATIRAEFAFLREGMNDLRKGMDEMRDEMRSALGIRRASR